MNRQRLWGIVAGGVAVAVGAVIACGQAERPGASGGTNPPGYSPYAGPCGPEGAVHECHVKISQSADGVVSCFIGQQECRGGQWSSCQGGDIKLQTLDYELSPATIRPLGLDGGPALSDSGTCTSDPCDPYCSGFNLDAGLQADAGPQSTTIPSGSIFGGAPGGFAGKSNCGEPPDGCNDVAPAPAYPRKCNGNPEHFSVWDSCLADTHCDRLKNNDAGACVADWSAGGAPNDARWSYVTKTWSTSVCPVGGGPDLTVGAACTDTTTSPSLDGFNVCNRGNDATAGNPGPTRPGLVDIYIDHGNSNFGSMISSATGCDALAKTPSCSVSIPGGTLAPGKCFLVTNVTCPAWSGSGNEVAYVNSAALITECGGKATGSFATAPGCNNNWADVMTGSNCSTITVYQPTSVTYAFNATCAPGLHPRWKWLTYQATVPRSPAGAKVEFFGTLSAPYLDASTPASYAETLISAATTTRSVDCTNNGDAGAPPPTCPTDLLAWASGIASNASGYTHLDVRVLITPPPDGSSTPTVPNMQVSYECVPSE